MRISRSESPAPFPPLDFILPEEKSWALEAEREACLPGEAEFGQSDTGVGQRDNGSCWTSSKRLHTGADVYLKNSKEKELTGSMSSRISDPKMHKSGRYAMRRYGDSQAELNSTEGRNRSLSFTTSSRCYPLNMHTQSTDRFSRGTESAKQVPPRSEIRQGCGTKWKKVLDFEVHHDARAREDRAFSSEDHSLLCKDEHSRKFAPLQNRAKRSYAEKVSFKGNCENEESPHHYRSAIRKRYNNAATNNGVGSSQISTCKSLLLESESYEELHGERVHEAVAKEQYENLASLLLGESENSDARRPEAQLRDAVTMDLAVSMEIDDGAEAKRMVPTTMGAPCPAKNHDLNTKMERNESAIKHSVQTSSNTSTSPVSRSSPSVFVDVTNQFELHASPGVREEAQETDAHRLSQRLRQIEFGKNTLGYERYTELVPRLKRKARDPQTPNPKQVCSKRSWDGQIRKWRRLLHVYDPPSEDGEEIAEDLSVLKFQRQEANHDGADASAHAQGQGFCDSYGIGGKNAFEGEMEKEDGSLIISDDGRIVIEDANLTIYDDWMES